MVERKKALSVSKQRNDKKKENKSLKRNCERFGNLLASCLKDWAPDKTVSFILIDTVQEVSFMTRVQV